MQLEDARRKCVCSSLSAEWNCSETPICSHKAELNILVPEHKASSWGLPRSCLIFSQPACAWMLLILLTWNCLFSLWVYIHQVNHVHRAEAHYFDDREICLCSSKRLAIVFSGIFMSACLFIWFFFFHCWNWSSKPFSKAANRIAMLINKTIHEWLYCYKTKVVILAISAVPVWFLNECPDSWSKVYSPKPKPAVWNKLHWMDHWVNQCLHLRILILRGLVTFSTGLHLNLVEFFFCTFGYLLYNILLCFIVNICFINIKKLSCSIALSEEFRH